MSKDLFLKLTENNSDKKQPSYRSDTPYFDLDFSSRIKEQPETDWSGTASDLWSGLGKGLASGVSFGASELMEGWEIDFDQMSDTEKAAYIIGEGASMLIPFMGLGTALKGATSLAKYGARGAIKKAAKESIKHSDIGTAGALKQAKKISKITGKTTEQVMKDIAPNLQKKVYDDLVRRQKGLNPFSKPYLEKVYQQAFEGDLKVQANKIIRDRVRASIQAGLGEQGIKLGSRQLDNIAGNFAEQIGKGVKFNDASRALATGFGRYGDPGKIARYFGMAANTSAIMITDQLIRQGMHHYTRGTEFDPMSAVKSGGIMGLLFPAVQRIPQAFGLGTGYRSALRELPQMAWARMMRRQNYAKMAKNYGEKPVRGLLKMQTKGGMFDVNNRSRLGDAYWNVGKGYKGSYDILRQVDDMPLDDVIGLLNAYKKEIGKATMKEWSKEFFADFAGSIPRVLAGITLMAGPTFRDYTMGHLSEEELMAHMVSSAFMTKSRGGWGMKKELNWQADFAPYKKALDDMGWDGRVLTEMVNVVDNPDAKIFGSSAKDNKVVRQIEEIFDIYADPEATPDKEGSNGFNSAEHEIVDRWQYVYNMVKAEKTPPNQRYEEIDIKSKNYTRSDLDNIANELKKIEFDDGLTLENIGPKRFNARITDESALRTKDAFGYLLDNLREMGLPIIKQQLKEGRVKYMVGEIKTKHGDGEKDFMAYNNLVKELQKANLVEIADNMEVRVETLLNMDKDIDVKFQEAFEVTIDGLNKEFNIHSAYEIDDNPYLDFITEQPRMEAIERMFSILKGDGVTKQDQRLAKNAVRLFDRATGEPGFLSSIDNYKIDYEGYAKDNKKTLEDAKKDFPEAELREDLRPLLEMLRISNTGVVKNPFASSKKLNVESANQIRKQFKEISDMLPADLKKDFGSKGANFFIKDMLSTQGIKPRVVNSIVELQERGLGNYNMTTGKMKVMSIDAIKTQASLDGESYTSKDIVDIENKARELYDAIGSQYIEQEDFIISPTSKTEFKSPTIQDFIKIHDNFKTEKIADFIKNTQQTIDLIESTQSHVEGKLDEVASGLAKISVDPMSLQTLSRLQEISVELKNIRHGDKFGKTYDKLIKGVDDLRADLSKFTKGDEIIGDPAQELDMLGKVKSMNEYITTMMKAEATENHNIRKLATDIRNNLINKKISDPSAARLVDKLSLELRKVLADEKSNTMSLDELLLEVNETGSWNATKNLLKGIQNQVDISLAQHEKLNIKPNEQDAFERLSDDKKIHHSSETLQTIAQRYGLTDPDNPNDVNMDIISKIVDGKDSPNMIRNLTKDVYKNLEDMTLPAAEKNALRQNWDGLKYSFVNNILRKRTRQTGSIIFDGEKVLLNVNSQSAYRDTPVTEWIGTKKYAVTYLNDRIVSPDKYGNLRQGDISSLDDMRSSGISINEHIRKNLQVIPEANYDIMKEVADGGKISEQKISQYQNEAKTGHYIEGDGFYIRLTPGNRLIFHGTPDNYNKLNNDFSSFYKKFSKYNFKDVEVTAADGSKRTVKGEALNQVFEQKFGGLTDIVKPTSQQAQNKLHAMFYSESSKSMFSEWLAANKVGNHDLRKSIESNMVKRGWLVDGGTTMKPHPAVIKDMARNHFDSEVRDIANKITSNKMKTNTVIYDDEAPGAGTNIIRRVKEQIKSKQSKATGDEISQHVYKEMLRDINNNKMPSLDMPLTDGAKYISKPLAKLMLSLKGESIDDLGGMKTILFQLGDENLLGKGYAVYDPIVAAEMSKSNADFALGKSAAKDFMLEKDALAVPGKEWYKALATAGTDNTIGLSIENIGIGFTSKKTEGVTISNSMLHLESRDYKKRAMKSDFIDSKRLLDVIDRTTQTKIDSRNELIAYLKQVKQDEGFIQSQGELGLTSELVSIGAEYANPIIKPKADRSLRDKYFQLLSQQTTQFGRDMTIVPDAESKLMMPEIVELAESAGGTETAFRVNKTFGDISPDINSLSDILPNLDNTTFVANYKGIDFMINTKKGGRAYSPLLETLSKNPNAGLKGTNAPEIPLDYRDPKAMYKKVLNEVQPIFNKLNQKLTWTNFSMKDIHHLLNGVAVSKVAPDGSMKRIKLTKSERDLVKKLDITLGASGIAIPLKGYDKAFHRIRNPHNQQGLVKINHYDERVIHQRDNDGDHFYVYNQVPFSMETVHALKQSFMKDFYMFDKTPPDINIFGIDVNRPDSKVGALTDVGPSRYLDHLDKQRFGIGKVIGDRGAIDLLSTLGFQQDGNSIVTDLSKMEHLGEDVSKIGNRTFTIFQNSVDIHGGTADVMQNKYSPDYFRYGEKPSHVKVKINGEDADLSTESLFREFGKNKNYSALEKDMVDIALRTVKDINILGSDIWQQGMQRSPEPSEISKAYYNIKTFYSDPTYYMVTKLASRYSKNKSALNDLIRYFYDDKISDIKDADRIEGFTKKLIEGKIPTGFKTRFSFKNFQNPGKEFARGNFDMFDVIPQGNYLREVALKNIFKDSNAMPGIKKNLHPKLGSIVQDALDRIGFLEASGKSIEDISDKFFWDNSVPDFDKPQTADMEASITLGSIRTALESMLGSYSREARYFNESNSKYDDGKFSRLQNKMKNVESALAVLNNQALKGLITKDNKLRNFHKYDPKKPMKKVSADTYIFSYKGSADDIAKLISDKKADLSMFGREGWVKAGESYKTYNGRTYIEIKNPVMQENLPENQKNYSKALSHITDQHQVEHIFQNDDVSQLAFIDDVQNVRKELSDAFSGAYNNAKNRPLSKRVWQMNDAKENSILGDFYRRNVEEFMNRTDMDEIEAHDWITKYLIKPQPMMSKMDRVRTGDGSFVDLPVYNMNNRLISSVYKYLKNRDMMPIVEDIVRRQEKFLRGEYTEADNFVDTNYNMYQDGYNWDNLEADFVKSLTGPSFRSPYWSQFRKSRAHGYDDFRVYRTFDRAKIAAVKPKIDESGCR